MYVIMGATGHVGSATAQALLDIGQPVAVVARDADSAGAWRSRGAKILEADVEDVAALRESFRQGRRAFLLNPPADTKKDTDAIERGTAANILAALDGSGLEKVVAESTFGARPGERIGDLSVLWEFEKGLADQSIPAAINRAAYYMSNWDTAIGTARESGTLATMFPADLKIPMVAPADLGLAAAHRLMSPVDDDGIRYVEGPERYSSQEVAITLAAALVHEVALKVTPYGRWREAFLDLGFSRSAAETYARMTQVSVDDGFELPVDPWRGSTTLQNCIRSVTIA